MKNKKLKEKLFITMNYVTNKRKVFIINLVKINYMT